MRPARVLHMVGSATSSFYHDLSMVYARSALQPETMQHTFAVVEPGGRWRAGPSLNNLGASVRISEFLNTLERPDLVVPYMFDRAGMTSFRSFFEDVLGIPVVGSEAGAAAMAADKAITKTVVGAAGVRVPRTFASAPDSSDYPVIVKPAREDNSLGLALVEHPDQLRSAILDAEQFDAGVIVEQYIPGREIRVAVIELGDELMVPAMLEYGVTHSHPMRTTDDKLELGDNGNPRAQAASLEAPMTCPAIVDSVLAASLEDQATRAHRSLGCRDYSLFDFRIDTETSEPYLLEACLFWTFGPLSIISRMIESGGDNPAAVATQVWRNRMRNSMTSATLT